MDSRRPLLIQLYLVAVVAVLHIVGTVLYLYWMFWWYDILVHFLASVWVALTAMWVAQQGGLSRKWIWALCAVLCVSIGWEVFEYGIGVTNRTDFALDTWLDMIVNLIGGVVGVYLAQRT